MVNYKKESREENTIDLIYNEAKDSLNILIQSIDGLNTKTSILIGFIGVILSTILGFSYSNYCLFVDGLVLLFVALFLCVYSFRVENYRKDPNLKALWDNYSEKDSKTIKKQLIANFIESYDETEAKINKKVKYINWSIIFLFLGLILLTLSTLL